MTWLVSEADRQLTPNRYSPNNQPQHIRPVEFIVYHFTAGSFDGALRWLTSTDSKVSAHFLIGKDGRLMQLAPLSDRTWHAGGRTSAWRDGRYVNDRSIGIEIENWGKLKPRADGVDAGWLTWNDKPYCEPVFLAKDGSGWDAYTKQQIQTALDLTRKLVAEFPVLKEGGDRFVGHQDLDPSRKTDPGPAFPWAKVRRAIRSMETVA